jgi:hypothetical protein
MSKLVLSKLDLLRISLYHLEQFISYFPICKGEITDIIELIKSRYTFEENPTLDEYIKLNHTIPTLETSVLVNYTKHVISDVFSIFRSYRNIIVIFLEFPEDYYITSVNTRKFFESGITRYYRRELNFIEDNIDNKNSIIYWLAWLNVIICYNSVTGAPFRTVDLVITSVSYLKYYYPLNKTPLIELRKYFESPDLSNIEDKLCFNYNINILDCVIFKLLNNRYILSDNQYFTTTYIPPWFIMVVIYSADIKVLANINDVELIKSFICWLQEYKDNTEIEYENIQYNQIHKFLNKEVVYITTNFMAYYKKPYYVEINKYVYNLTLKQELLRVLSLQHPHEVAVRNFPIVDTIYYENLCQLVKYSPKVVLDDISLNNRAFNSMITYDILAALYINLRDSEISYLYQEYFTKYEFNKLNLGSTLTIRKELIANPLLNYNYDVVFHNNLDFRVIILSAVISHNTHERINDTLIIITLGVLREKNNKAYKCLFGHLLVDNIVCLRYFKKEQFTTNYLISLIKFYDTKYKETYEVKYAVAIIGILLYFNIESDELIDNYLLIFLENADEEIQYEIFLMKHQEEIIDISYWKVDDKIKFVNCIDKLNTKFIKYVLKNKICYNINDLLHNQPTNWSSSILYYVIKTLMDVNLCKMKECNKTISTNLYVCLNGVCEKEFVKITHYFLSHIKVYEESELSSYYVKQYNRVLVSEEGWYFIENSKYKIELIQDYDVYNFDVLTNFITKLDRTSLELPLSIVIRWYNSNDIENIISLYSRWNEPKLYKILTAYDGRIIQDIINKLGSDRFYRVCLKYIKQMFVYIVYHLSRENYAEFITWLLSLSYEEKYSIYKYLSVDVNKKIGMYDMLYTYLVQDVVDIILKY